MDPIDYNLIRGISEEVEDLLKNLGVKYVKNLSEWKRDYERDHEIGSIFVLDPEEKTFSFYKRPYGFIRLIDGGIDTIENYDFDFYWLSNEYIRMKKNQGKMPDIPFDDVDDNLPINIVGENPLITVLAETIINSDISIESVDKKSFMNYILGETNFSAHVDIYRENFVRKILKKINELDNSLLEQTILILD